MREQDVLWQWSPVRDVGVTASASSSRGGGCGVGVVSSSSSSSEHSRRHGEHRMLS